MRSKELRIWGLEGIPEIESGDDLGEIIAIRLRGKLLHAPVEERGVSIPILVVAQKIVSKSEGRIVQLDSITPSAQASGWARRFGKDPRMVEIVLRQSRRIVRMDRGVLITETHHGFVCANAGVDASNAPPGTVVLLPEDPDRSAARLREGLQSRLDIDLAVIISDTFGRPWRQGLTNVALGVSGIPPLKDYRGKADFYGRPLHATVLASADEIAAAAELVMGKTRGIPVAVVEGFCDRKDSGSGKELLRPPDLDLFR